jgi:hypothetical protein
MAAQFVEVPGDQLRLRLHFSEDAYYPPNNAVVVFRK